MNRRGQSEQKLSNRTVWEGSGKGNILAEMLRIRELFMLVCPPHLSTNNTKWRHKSPPIDLPTYKIYRALQVLVRQFQGNPEQKCQPPNTERSPGDIRGSKISPRSLSAKVRLESRQYSRVAKKTGPENRAYSKLRPSPFHLGDLQNLSPDISALTMTALLHCEGQQIIHGNTHTVPGKHSGHVTVTKASFQPLGCPASQNLFTPLLLLSKMKLKVITPIFPRPWVNKRHPDSCLQTHWASHGPMSWLTTLAQKVGGCSCFRPPQLGRHESETHFIPPLPKRHC